MIDATSDEVYFRCTILNAGCDSLSCFVFIKNKISFGRIIYIINKQQQKEATPETHLPFGIGLSNLGVFKLFFFSLHFYCNWLNLQGIQMAHVTTKTFIRCQFNVPL